MLIWGTYVMQRTIENGKFYCPHCQQHRQYLLRQPRKWGHLYWIPLIPLKEFEKYVECTNCNNAFDLRVLGYDPTTQHKEALILVMGAICQAVLHMANAQKRRPSAEEVASAIYVVLSLEPPLDEIKRMLVSPHVTEGTELMEAAADILSADGKEAILLTLSAALAGPSSRFAAFAIGKRLGMTDAHISGVLASCESTPRRPSRIKTKSQNDQLRNLMPGTV